jgi:hypothetical protein
MGSEHLVSRVPEVVHRLLGELLSETVIKSLRGAKTVSAKRVTTLHENTDAVHAHLTITLELEVSDA